jgi:dihydroxy-acid dehydratase
MKTSVISKEFRDRYLSDPEHPNVFSGRAIVFDGPEDYHDRIDDPALEIDDDCLLFVRGAGPLGYPGSAEVVNMQPPAALIKRGVHELPCIGDGRQSGTSGSPSILNASPEAAAGGGLALLRTGDPVRIDLVAGTVNVLLPEAELDERRRALRRPAATRCRRRRRRGRRSSAAWSTSSATAWSCVRPSPTSASPGPRHPRHSH